jgi:hypothetical protein
LFTRHQARRTSSSFGESIATSKVCSTASPLDLLPQPVAAEPKPVEFTNAASGEQTGTGMVAAVANVQNAATYNDRGLAKQHKGCSIAV